MALFIDASAKSNSLFVSIRKAWNIRVFTFGCFETCSIAFTKSSVVSNLSFFLISQITFAIASL
jgi:hypothetical protein